VARLERWLLRWLEKVSDKVYSQRFLTRIEKWFLAGHSRNYLTRQKVSGWAW
jgi:hypothetical protein